MREFTELEKEEIKKEIKNLLSDKKARDTLEIIEYLGYGKEMDSEIIKILSEMTSVYDLYMTKKGRYLNFLDSDMALEYYKGIFIASKGEYGFVNVENLKEDIFIPGDFKNSALDGDLVLVKITKGETNSKKCEGKVVQVLKRNPKTKIGEVCIEKGKFYCILNNSKKKELLQLEGENLDKLVDGDIITIEVLNGLKARFKSRIGHKNDPGIDIIEVLAEHEFPVEFSLDAIKQLETLPTKVEESDLKGRVDYRDEMIFTIDGDDTKDIDDAISVKKLSNGHYELGVHIANVPYYIKEGSPLDLDARERGTSVYLADRVVPMYPHQVSNGICSLNPGVDRLTMSSIMEIDENGNMIDYRIEESVIRSRIQMTYKNVNLILEDGVVPEGYAPYVETLKLMKELADLVRKNKVKRGYIDFSIDEAKIIVDDTGRAIDIKKRYRGSGEKMIEDFMILANESVAETITNMSLPGIYRVHGEVNIDRLRKFLKVLKNYNIVVKDDFKFVNQKQMQEILLKMKDLDAFQILATRMISCMDKARYDVNNIGHFALASRDYTHFTSPIRRYPDTTIHRLLHDYLFRDLENDRINHWESILTDIAISSSERERAAMDSERVVDDMKMAEYMESHIGETFSGMVSGITKFGMTSFGMYVELPNLVEGMVRLESLPERFVYDEENESLIGVVSHKIYTLGTKVMVKVISASKELGQIDFELIEKEKEVDDENKKVKTFKKKY